MRTITFKVKQQKIRNTNSINNVFSGTNNYLNLSFEFDEENWKECKKAIVFEGRGVTSLLEGDSFLVPSEAFSSTGLTFYIVGKRKDGYRIETQKFTINLKR